MEVTAVPVSASLGVERASWWRGYIFRVGFIFWSLACLTALLFNSPLFGWLEPVARPVAQAIVTGLGRLLGITSDIPYQDNGSGDTLGDWLFLLATVIAAVVGALIWSAIDRRRARDAWLRERLRIAVRYTLAGIVVYYGVIKVMCLQFPAPSLGRLLQPYGKSSPMGLMWTFMGASAPYQIFAGTTEVLGSLLLLFRRTTTLGALLLAMVLTNVVMLNFCYDVPVKIASSTYLGMCCYLLAPEARRFMTFLWAHHSSPRATGLWGRFGRPAVKVGAITFILVMTLRPVIPRATDTVAAHWYDGYWKVTAFTRNGHELPPLATDSVRWSRMRFQPRADGLVARWVTMDDTFGPLYDVKVDEAQQRMQLSASNADTSQTGAPLELHYTKRDDRHWRLEGKIAGAQVAADLEPLDAGSMLLTSRGFHWINEQPFNR